MRNDVHARPCSGPEPPEETPQESLRKIEDRIEPECREFYRTAITIVQEAGVPLLVGGAFAFEFYTGISRYTKDFDIFIRAADIEKTLNMLKAAGYTTEITAPHWLSKVCWQGNYVDIIFGEAN